MAKKKKASGEESGSGQDLRNVGIFKAAAEGKTQGEIAEEFGLTRQRVNTILNSDEAKRLTEQARGQLQSLLGTAVDTLTDALNGRYEDMRTASNVALAILKGCGVLTEKVEHEVMKPFIMQLLNGDKIVMGHKPEGE